jgi:hypothetical protein
MAQLLDEIRNGAPGVGDANRHGTATTEIPADSVRRPRDAHDAAGTQDLVVTVDSSHRSQLLAQINAHHASGKIVLRFDVPMGVLPPDPMGPAMVASMTYLSTLNPPPDADGVSSPPSVSACVTAMLSLRAGMTAAFSGTPPASFPPGSAPVTPNEVSLPQNPTVQRQVNALQNAAYAAAAAIYTTYYVNEAPIDSFSSAAYNAALALYDAVQSEFR